MKINRVKYLIVSTDEKMYVHLLIDYNGGKNYTGITFDSNYKFAMNFASKKDAKLAQNKILECTPPFFVIYNNNYYSKKTHTIYSLPDTKIVKMSLIIEDINE